MYLEFIDEVEYEHVPKSFHRSLLEKTRIRGQKEECFDATVEDFEVRGLLVKVEKKTKALDLQWEVRSIRTELTKIGREKESIKESLKQFMAGGSQSRNFMQISVLTAYLPSRGDIRIQDTHQISSMSPTCYMKTDLGLNVNPTDLPPRHI
ncbi:hypothetical protein P154DRAFT_571511 [Amniculicola lignicola CBS 123094]|uniref:Uncharacterized protein n=1 Tax=Amniculicola lignicola CBS 123094 TaxID=1392246 RepID=A0A6A5WWH6_9PLEO|nr:hypothetical protein P154DRAFT_571511 [Amniculicola lignicola CBS 123094]